MPRTSIFAAVAVAATVAMIRCCEGLACFENTEAPIGSAQIVLRNESSIKYCVAAPSSTFDWGSEARLFGINALEDRTDVYDQIFRDNSKQYQVLTLCLMEKYAVQDVEFSFRCMCNYDKCNKALDLETYMKRMYMENRG